MRNFIAFIWWKEERRLIRSTPLVNLTGGGAKIENVLGWGCSNAMQCRLHVSVCRGQGAARSTMRPLGYTVFQAAFAPTDDRRKLSASFL